MQKCASLMSCLAYHLAGICCSWFQIAMDQCHRAPGGNSCLNLRSPGGKPILAVLTNTEGESWSCLCACYTEWFQLWRVELSEMQCMQLFTLKLCVFLPSAFLAYQGCEYHVKRQDDVSGTTVVGSGRHNPSPPVAESIERSGGFREVTMPWQYRNSKVCCIGHAPIGAWSTVSAVTVSDVFLTRQKNNFLAFLSCCDTIFCIFSIPMGSGWEHRDKKLESCMHYFQIQIKIAWTGCLMLWRLQVDALRCMWNENELSDATAWSCDFCVLFSSLNVGACFIFA